MLHAIPVQPRKKLADSRDRTLAYPFYSITQPRSESLLNMALRRFKESLYVADTSEV